MLRSSANRLWRASKSTTPPAPPEPAKTEGRPTYHAKRQQPANISANHSHQQQVAVGSPAWMGRWSLEARGRLAKAAARLALACVPQGRRGCVKAVREACQAQAGLSAQKTTEYVNAKLYSREQHSVDSQNQSLTNRARVRVRGRRSGTVPRWARARRELGRC